MAYSIILTGCTGILGRHILYELLINKYQNKEINNIYLLIRSSSQKTVNNKIESILKHSYRPTQLDFYEKIENFSCIKIIDADLLDINLSAKIKEAKIKDTCIVIHNGATTNLGINKMAYDENYNINYLGTCNLLKAVSYLSKKFIFISTTYSCGIQEGLIPENYLEVKNKIFRNYYEEIKAKTETYVQNKCQELSLEYQIIRPGIICGRLLDAPLFFTPKFNVFYEYANFFFRNIYLKNLSLRISCNLEAGLHIIPVDYVAKGIIKSLNSDHQQINITNNKQLKLTNFFQKTLSIFEFDNFEFVDHITKPNNKLEKLYYHTVGKIFHSYFINPNYDYQVKTIQSLLPNTSIPDIEENFENILLFAKQNLFKNL